MAQRALPASVFPYKKCDRMRKRNAAHVFYRADLPKIAVSVYFLPINPNALYQLLIHILIPPNFLLQAVNQ